MKKASLFIFAAFLLFALAGCGGKEEKTGSVSTEEGVVSEMPAGETMPPEEVGTPPEGMDAGMPPGMGAQRPPVPKSVIVPESAKNTFVASKILIKKKGSDDEGKVYEVSPDETIDIPESNLSVKVGQYLPDFYMDGQTITSKSDERNNPTVMIVVYEDGKEVFSGWSFEKYPEIHAFTHPEYSISLVGAVEAEN